jgi:hypothetical protein
MFNLVHLLAQPVGWGARAVGGVQNALPGGGDSSLNQVGRAITSGTANLSNPSGLLTGANAFTDPTEQPGYGKTSAGPTGQSPTPDSNPQPSGGVLTSGTGGSTTVDPAVAAFLGQQIGAVQSQIGALPDQLAVGRSNILSSANDALNREGLSFGQAERDYNTNKNQTIQDELSAKQNIDTGVRQQTNALQRLLGLAGSGTSSASQILAPYAAGRQGNIQRSQVQTGYGRNLGALDTAWGDTTQAHKQNINDVNSQEFQNEQSLANNINNTKASLLQTLAGLTLQQSQAAGTSLSDAQAAAQPYMQQIADIIKGSAALGAQYKNPISLAAPSVFQAPSLDAYNYDVSAPPVSSTDVTYGDQVTPYITSLLQNKDKSNLVYSGQ